MPIRPRITLKPGKSYTYTGTEGTYSVIAGELLEGDSVAAGGNLVYGAGAPSVGTGKDGDVYLDLTDFKVHTKGSGAWGSGSLFKGAAGTSGSAGAKGDTGTGGTKGDAGLRGKVTLEGSGAPGTGSNLATPTAALTDALTDASLTSGDLDLGDIYLDTTNHRFYKKTSLGWATRGATFVGTTGSKGDTGTTGTTGSKGDAGLRGKVTLEGAGAPGTGSNLATPTAALTDALTDASLTSGDLDVGDLYLDTTNHRFYKKTALGWATRGLTFVGPTGTKGDTGTTGNTGSAGTKGDTGNTGSAGTKGDTGNTGSDGAGVNKYSSALTADTYLSTGSTASTSTTSASTFYPATLNLTDLMEDVGAVVTRSSITYNRSASATATGSRFSIASAGRYKIDCAVTFNVTTANSNLNVVNLNVGIYYSIDSGSTWTALQTQTAAFSTTSSATAQTTLELSKTSFLPVGALGTKIEFRASRSSSSESTIVSVNAVTKTEVGEDTFVMFTKL